MEIGQYSVVNHSQTLKGLELENATLKNRQNKLITIAVGSAIIAVVVYLQYLQIKEELKKNEIRITNPENNNLKNK
jgi:hypothetical protein